MNSIVLKYYPWEASTKGELKDLNLLLDRHGRLVQLGEGRFARVLLAKEGQTYYALKFLKADGSTAYQLTVRERFYTEVFKARALRQNKTVFVESFGFGHALLPSLHAQLTPTRVSPSRRGGGDTADGGEADTVVKKAPGGGSGPNLSLCESERELYTEVLGDNRFPESAARGNQDHLASLIDKTSVARFFFPDDPSQRVQGDFLVLRAFEGSLEDFLLDPKPWVERRLFDFDGSTQKALDSRLPGRVRELAAARLAALEIPQGTHSGFAILQSLARKAPALRNAIVFELLDRIMKVLHTIHEEGIVHRDLKPGNILLSAASGDDLLLADLGFVSEVDELNRTIVRESEPAGSFMFRAPEQQNPSLDVRVTRATKDDPMTVVYYDVGGFCPEVGDRLKCAGREAEIRAARRVEAGIELHLDQDLKIPEGEAVLAYIHRASGFHTDMFAAGALLYFLATGGKNPEDLYVKVLSQVDVARLPLDRESDDQAANAEDTCFDVALDLCLAAADEIADDLTAYMASISVWPEALRQHDAAATAGHLEAIVRRRRPDVGRLLSKRSSGLLTKLIGKADSPEAMRARYGRRSQRHSTLLQDRVGAPLSFPVLYETIKCMLRGRADSYVGKAPHQTWYAPDVVASIAEGRNRLIATISQVLTARSCSYDRKIIVWLANTTAADPFFRLLRCCSATGGRKQPAQRQPSNLGEPDPPEQTRAVGEGEGGE